MACIRYRAQDLKVDRAVYVTDVGQEFHFKQVFEAGEKCGYVDRKVTKLDHMMFGMVLQENEEGKAEKIKTREGKSVKLAELLDEARDRALKSFEERLNMKKDDKKEEEKKEETLEAEVAQKVQIEGDQALKEAAEILGISSIKYYDLK